MSPKEVMKKGKKPEGKKNTTKRWPRGRKYRYQTKCLAECPGRIFHMYQGQASQVFLKINPVDEMRSLNKQQEILPLSFLWLLIGASGQWLKQRVPVRGLQRHWNGKCGIRDVSCRWKAQCSHPREPWQTLKRKRHPVTRKRLQTTEGGPGPELKWQQYKTLIGQEHELSSLNLSNTVIFDVWNEHLL